MDRIRTCEIQKSLIIHAKQYSILEKLKSAGQQANSNLGPHTCSISDLPSNVVDRPFGCHVKPAPSGNIPEAVPLPYLGKCTTKGCYSFAWGVLGENDAPWVNSTVDFLIDKGNLTETEDTRFVFKDSNPIKFLTEPGKEMNGAQVMVLFCTDYMSVTPAAGQDPVKIPCNSNQLFGENYGYWILYNSTLTKQAMLSGTSTPSGLNEVALATKRTIDEAIVNF